MGSALELLGMQQAVRGWLVDLSAIGAFRAAAWLALGLPAAFLVARLLSRWASKTYHLQAGLVVHKLVLYPSVIGVATGALVAMGVSLAPVLGAAGVLGIALGFASQTSVSNVISGFFLLGEQPFVVDDVIQVGTTLGRVMSVGTLSVQLRTFDNRFIRIPNESLIKSEVVNLTRFPVRRMDISVGVVYRTDPDEAEAALLDAAGEVGKALVEPEPQVWYDGFGESSFNLRLSVWAETASYWEVKNEVHKRIKRTFDDRGLSFAFPHRTLVPADGTSATTYQFVAGTVDDDGARGSEPVST